MSGYNMFKRLIFSSDRAICALFLIVFVCAACKQSRTPIKIPTSKKAQVSMKKKIKKAQTPTKEKIEKHPCHRVFNLLRTGFDKLRKTDQSKILRLKPVKAGCLKGLPRKMIETKLGKAHRCKMAFQTICIPSKNPKKPPRCTKKLTPTPAPCQSASDRFYSFYHLPKTYSGGGFELLLSFDKDICSSAKWFHTQ